MSRYHDRIYGVIARLVRDADHARDLVQEAFLKAWRGLPRFEGTSSFYTWLYRIARNLVISDISRAMARPRVTLSLDESADEHHGEVVDSRDGPGTTTLKGERRRLVADAILALVPDFREIIVLRDVEGLSYEEIAELLEIPVGTVRSRLHRARLELKARLADILI